MSSASPPLAGLIDVELERPAFGAIVESLPDPVLVIAAHDAENLADRRVIYANPAARELLRIQGEGAPWSRPFAILGCWRRWTRACSASINGEVGL